MPGRGWYGKEQGFEVGEDVIYSPGFGRSFIKKVVKVTPSGIVRLEGWPATGFYPDGSQVGAESYHRSHINKVTPKRLRELEHERRLDDFDFLLRRFKWTRATIEDMDAVQAIIAPYLRRD